MAFLLRGGCLCGAVRYEIDQEPVGAGNCHCRTCQLAVGAPFLPALFVVYPSLKVSGEYREFEIRADSGNLMYRAFCVKCGTTLFARNAANKEIRPVNAMTLDDPSVYQPNVDFWVSSAQPWVCMDPDTDKFEQSPAHL